MSEVIVRMEMPKRCFDCPMHDWTYGLHETRQNVLVCNARHELTPIPNGDERPDWCPIVGVLPEQHGRLGDLDRLANMVNGLRIDAMLKGSDTNPYWLLVDIIAQAKTIVPAERKDDGRTTD